MAEGGNPTDESFAACIAEHESGGNPGAISPTSDYGLWQEHDDPAALNPAISAKTAVQMSSDGTDGKRGPPSPTADFPAAARRARAAFPKITRYNLRAPGGKHGVTLPPSR